MANKIKLDTEDRIVDFVVYLIIAFVFIVTLYPFYYAVVISFNSGIDASRGGIFLWPRVFTLDNYKAVFSDQSLIGGFAVTIARTLIGTLSSLAFTGLFAYSLSHRNLMFRKLYIFLMIVAMYFSGGLIPTFILYKYLHLFNSFWVYIVPNLLSVFNAIIMMNFFSEIPSTLEESAHIDGANDWQIFFRIILPVSAPIFATIALFNGVGHWNAWFDAAYFITNKKLKTVSYMLMELINRANLTSVQGMSTADAQRAETMATQTFTAETIRMATMIVVVIPIICVYPFLQKYFVKGMMIGSIKG